MSKKATIEINSVWCKGCEICVDVCPKQVLGMKNFVAEILNDDACNGCQLCELLCPDFAITVTKHDSAEEKTGT
ncbi:MAG: 4Fe-4S binding protein [Deltaproteobacteria bacterium]|nr:4Fe-4S binding protein [Deltaproteobacteria bacterium]